MANYNIKRTLNLFFGMGDPEIADAMTPFGFRQAVLDDGLQVLVRGSILRKDGVTLAASKRTVVAELEEVAATWVPVVKAVLGVHYPEVAAKVKLERETGREATLSVAGLLVQLAEMKDPKGRFGAEGPAARALLEARGLTAEVEAKAQALVKSLTDIPELSEAEAEADEAAAEAVRQWYREWSAIARVAVKEKRLRRKLGFLKRRPIEEQEVEVPVVPAPLVTAPLANLPALPAPTAPVTTVAESVVVAPCAACR